PNHLVLDWNVYFTADNPTKDDWKNIIAPSLKNIRRALMRKAKPQRQVWLPSRVHLSAGLAYGWMFRATKGFQLIASDALKEENPEDVADESLFGKLEFSMSSVSRKNNSLLLGISIAKDVRPTIIRMTTNGYACRAKLLGDIENLGRTSIFNTTHANKLAEATVKSILTARDRYKTQKIDLLISSSVQYATYLGWHLNACGDFAYWQYRMKYGDAIPSCDLDSLWDGES
ncbi:MAG: SAVED domain-containing protein, partial [Kouleothrix sp.]|nr:SAVED domain-containing protein [Kouleothrix sp.]